MSTYRAPKPNYDANYVGPHGPMNAQVYVVAERPGRHENNMHIPLIGDAGDDFNQMWLPSAHLRRSDVRVHNVYQYYHPENLDPTMTEVALGMPDLMQDISLVNPRFIIAMGRFALSVFKGVSPDQIDTGFENGVPFKWQGRIVIPVYHPSACWHSKMIYRRNVWAWERVRKVIHEGWWFPEWQAGKYGPIDMQPPLHLPVSVDTETADEKPWMVQCSSTPGTGYYTMTDNPLDMPVVREWIERSPLVIAHHAMFDLDILDQCGIHPQQWTDTLIMAYLLGDEHQGLKDLAYKHFGVVLPTYEETVLPSTRARAKAYLEQIAQHQVSATRVFRVKSGKKGDSWAEFKAEHGIKPILPVEFKRLDTKEWQVTWTASTIPDPELIEELKDRKIHMRQPTNIVKRVLLLLDTIESDLTIDPVDKWRKMKDKDQAIEMFGEPSMGSLAEIPFDDAVEYGCKDPDVTMRLYPILHKRIQEEGLEEVLRIDMEAIPFLIDMQRSGLRVDADTLTSFGLELDERIVQLNFRIQQELINADYMRPDQVFNPGSHVQVMSALAKWKQFPKSTNIKDLEVLVRKVPWLRDHIEYKHLQKLRGTYVDGLLKKIQEDGRIYAKYNNNIADTGRLTSSDPNFQNIPAHSKDGKHIREAFVPTEGCVLGGFDYKQIEPRLMAHYSQDPVMLDVFRNNKDPYSTTASEITGMDVRDVPKSLRSAVKAVYLGVAYLLTPFGLRNDLESKDVRKDDGTLYTEDECADWIAHFYGVHKGFKRWQDEYLAQCEVTGKSRDLFGRYRMVPMIKSPIEKYRNEGRRMAANNAMQSGAGVIMKMVMHKARRAYKSLQGQNRILRPVNMIHDEFQFEATHDIMPVWVPTICSIMENVVQLSVPLGVDVELSAKSWADQREIGDWRTFNYNEWRKEADHARI